MRNYFLLIKKWSRILPLLNLKITIKNTSYYHKEKVKCENMGIHRKCLAISINKNKSKIK